MESLNPKDEKNIVYPLGLVDSGSDITIIDHEFGEALGFDLQKARRGQKITVTGVGGGKINIYLYEVGFLLGERSGMEPINTQTLSALRAQIFPLLCLNKQPF